jgi:hypothetical protein
MISAGLAPRSNWLPPGRYVNRSAEPCVGAAHGNESSATTTGAIAAGDAFARGAGPTPAGAGAGESPGAEGGVAVDATRAGSGDDGAVATPSS